MLLFEKDTKMDPILGGALVSAGSGIVNNALGMLGGKRQDKRQRRQMDYSQKLSKELWDYTNAENQVKHYKDAGLNVGLMYDKGGTSASTGSFGTNAGMEQVQGMDIASNIMAQGQIKLQEAQARDLNATAESKEMDNETKRMFGQDADKYEAGNRASEALVKGNYMFSQEDVNNSDLMNTKYGKQLDNNWTINNVEAIIKKEGMNDELEQIGLKTAGMALDNQLKELNKELTSEQTRKIWHDIWQGWTNAGFNGLGKIINASILKNLGDGKSNK